jgi:transposase-like protein
MRMSHLSTTANHRQRTTTALEKSQVVLSVLEGRYSPSEAASICGKHVDTIHRWKASFLAGGHAWLANERSSPTSIEAAELERLRRRLVDLERQLEIAKKARRS